MSKLYHTDFDKGHRCPDCRRIILGDDEGSLKFWRIYKCNDCGIRVANRPFLPVYPGTWYPFHGYIGWKQRIYWFWWEDPKRKLAWQWYTRGRRWIRRARIWR